MNRLKLKPIECTQFDCVMYVYFNKLVKIPISHGSLYMFKCVSSVRLCVTLLHDSTVTSRRCYSRKRERGKEGDTGILTLGMRAVAVLLAVSARALAPLTLRGGPPSPGQDATATQDALDNTTAPAGVRRRSLL